MCAHAVSTFAMIDCTNFCCSTCYMCAPNRDELIIVLLVCGATQIFQNSFLGTFCWSGSTCAYFFSQSRRGTCDLCLVFF
jgi:hypothetical protein